MNQALAYKRQMPQNQPNKSINAYLENQILNAKPEELILKIYDFILLHMKKQNYKKANAGLIELIASLNFDYQEQALGFFRLYTYCQQLIRQEKWDEAIHIIRELRDTWAKAFKLTKER
jgi:flagellin-specific chaperone FliS